MRERIIKIISGIDEDADIKAMLASPHMRLADTIGFDSLDYIGLCLDLEKVFAVEISDDEHHELASLETIERMIARKTNG